MTFHIGIDPSRGEVSYYLESNKKKTAFPEINVCKVTPDEIEKVQTIFDEIKLKINGNLGFLCIYLNPEYNQEARKKFIECSLKCRFHNVEIINDKTIVYLESISQIKYKPLNGNIFWICMSFYLIDIWEIKNQKAIYIGEFKADSSKLNELQKVVNESKLYKGPDIVIQYDEINKVNIGKISNDCEYFEIKHDRYWCSRLCLLKARTAAGDRQLSHFYVSSFLSQKLSSKIEDKEIAAFNVAQKLPIIFFSQIIKKPGDYILKVELCRDYGNYNEIDTFELPNYNEINLIFNIDTNEIFSVSFEKMPDFP
uniref:Uncharacterized protein n=1 Tax=Panagrolaimus sp. PS1159 TaxID=55785 RepID=A0AC35F970_9BILA